MKWRKFKSGISIRNGKNVYLKYYLLAFFKLGAFMILPPYIAGIIVGIFRPKNASRYAFFIGIGFVVISELVILIEKGAPFLFSNLYFMFSLSPIVWVQYLLGIGGMILWAHFAVSLYKNGLKLPSKFSSSADDR